MAVFSNNDIDFWVNVGCTIYHDTLIFSVLL